MPNMCISINNKFKYNLNLGSDLTNVNLGLEITYCNQIIFRSSDKLNIRSSDYKENNQKYRIKGSL